MRVRLLRALARASDLLIVDEPTNDLDCEARQSLYEFVRNFHGGLIIISHDRELLNRVDGIWELSNQGLSLYGGNFDFYEKLKKEERERLAQDLDIARREKKKQERAHAEKIERQ